MRYCLVTQFSEVQPDERNVTKGFLIDRCDTRTVETRSRISHLKANLDKCVQISDMFSINTLTHSVFGYNDVPWVSHNDNHPVEEASVAEMPSKCQLTWCSRGFRDTHCKKRRFVAQSRPIEVRCSRRYCCNTITIFM